MTRGPASTTHPANRREVQLRRKLEQMQSEIGGMIGTLNRIEQELAQVLANGGTISLDTKGNYMTGALARFQKDLGVATYLQSEQVTVRPPIPTR